MIIAFYSCNGQSSAKTDSIEFCGKQFPAPPGCETTGNLIKCNDYFFTWTYEPTADLPRHKAELLEQIENPRKVNTSVLKNDNIGYLSKMGTSYQLLIIGEINGKGVIITLWQDKQIISTNDLPEYVRQFITIKS